MPRRLLRDGRIVDDDWLYLAEAPDRDLSSLIVSFDQWLQDRETLTSFPGRLGVVLAPAQAVETLVPDLGRFALIAAQFDAPSEGRGYTQARLLRERWKFAGELRAIGCVRQDQLFFLARCGFNSFELPDSEMHEAHKALSTFSWAYQPSNDLGLDHALRHREEPRGSRLGGDGQPRPTDTPASA